MLHNQLTHGITYACMHIYNRHRNTHMHAFIPSTCGKHQVHKPAEKSFPEQASEAIPQRRGKKVFF